MSSAAGLLRRLRDEVATHAILLAEGREAASLARHPLIRQLGSKLHHESVTSIEAMLDELFTDLCEGEEFEHTEVVMALLVALDMASSPLFDELALAHTDPCRRSSQAPSLRGAAHASQLRCESALRSRTLRGSGWRHARRSVRQEPDGQPASRPRRPATLCTCAGTAGAGR